MEGLFCRPVGSRQITLHGTYRAHLLRENGLLQTNHFWLTGRLAGKHLEWQARLQHHNIAAGGIQPLGLTKCPNSGKQSGARHQAYWNDWNYALSSYHPVIFLACMWSEYCRNRGQRLV
jgi:hypothetical protein